jgi:predicted DNA-binding transcriptional regulator AlpA
MPTNSDAQAPVTPVRYLRFKQLREIIPVTRSTLGVWVREGRFPLPYKLNEASTNGPVAWREDEVLAWQASRERGFGPGWPRSWQGRKEKARRRRAEAAFEARRREAQRTGVTAGPIHFRRGD